MPSLQNVKTAAPKTATALASVILPEAVKSPETYVMIEATNTMAFSFLTLIFVFSPSSNSDKYADKGCGNRDR